MNAFKAQAPLSVYTASYEVHTVKPAASCMTALQSLPLRSGNLPFQSMQQHVFKSLHRFSLCVDIHGESLVAVLRRFCVLTCFEPLQETHC